MRKIIILLLVLSASAEAWSLRLDNQCYKQAKNIFDASGRNDLRIKFAMDSAPQKLEASLVFPEYRGCFFKGSSGEKVSVVTVARDVAGSRFVLVGETHDRIEDHLSQLEVIEALVDYKGSENSAVGFEMLNFTHQKSLDLYISKAIDEDEFKSRVSWSKEWGFPFELYKPIFDFLRENSVDAIALNAPRYLVAKVAMGGIKSLSKEERAMLPEDMDMSQDPRYIEFLREVFNGHGTEKMGPWQILKSIASPGRRMKFENFLEAMMVWNETMAHNAAMYAQEHPEAIVTVVAGNGHVIYNAGIPFGISRRIDGVKQASAYLQGNDGCPSVMEEDYLGFADYIWFVPQ
ncbi:ChaN family lipoprotein [Elusimicrobiota bacterium]